MLALPRILRGLLLLPAIAACASRTGAPAAAATATSRTPYRIAYTVALNDPSSHLYNLGIAVDGVKGDTLVLQLPVWSPGRYARMDFARNVQEFSATDASGAPLAWDKANGSRWRIATRGNDAVRIKYRVFANNLSGTFSILDSAHANWNGASLFMYVDGHKQDAVGLRVVAPAGWMLVNGASRNPSQRDFTFPTYDELIDTPTEIAPSLDVDSFRVDGRLYRVMVHYTGDQRAQRARFVRDVERVVRYQNSVIAPPPLEMYTFMVNLGFGGGDGMEHLYSTQIVTGAGWTDSATVLSGMGTVSHEYFHTWNVKRIRPVALGPFDYTTEQYQPSLWVAEGWTNYYGVMTLHRAGILGRAQLYTNLARTIRYNSESPGRKELSARMSSFHAPFWDGSALPALNNGANTWISYYLKGEALGMLLDLELRARTGNARSLDDVLRLLKQWTWDAPFDSYYLQGRGYTEADVERAASEVAGADLHPWFARYVAGVEELPWNETLAHAGLRLRVSAEPREYKLEESEQPTDAQRRVRDGWLSGSVGAPR